jgi:hypothetical protein
MTSSKKSFSGFSWYICSRFKQCTRAATRHFPNLSYAHCFCEHLYHVGALRCADECKGELHGGVTARAASATALPITKHWSKGMLRTCRLLAKLKLFLVALRSTGATSHLRSAHTSTFSRQLTINFVCDNNAGYGGPVLLQLRVPFR